jgi:hypothetical protein
MAEEIVMGSLFFFLAVIVPLLLLCLAFGPKLLLVKSIWVGAGVLLFVCGIMIASNGGATALIAGLFFAASGVMVVVAAVKIYLQTHLRWSRERRESHGKSGTVAILDNLE